MSHPTPGPPSSRFAAYLGYAALGQRIAAFLIDAFVILFLGLAVARFLRDNAPGLLEWLAFRGQDERFESVQFIVAAVYFIGFEMTGATPGKRLLRLRIIRQTGEPVTPWSSLLRNLLRPVDLLFFGLVGVISISTSDQRQRLGDRLAHTIVVQRRPS